MSFETDDEERVKKIEVETFDHTEAGVKMRLKKMSLYLLNEEDFGISPSEFRPDRHEHAIPKFEMARIYLIVCAVTGDHLGFLQGDRGDPVYSIYERAYQRSLRLENDEALLKKIRRVGVECGFQTDDFSEERVP